MKKIRKYSHLEVLEKKPSIEEVKAAKKENIVFVLDNLRSLYNVGSLFRTLDGVGGKKMYLCGITGFPPNREIEKTALGAVEVVEWEYFENAFDCIKKLKNEGYKIYCVEIGEGSKNYSDVKYEVPCAIVLGNEVEGVSDSVIEECDLMISIPMKGRANSLNVATAGAIVGYEAARAIGF